MTRLTKEPGAIHSMPELLATAKVMELEAVAGYEALAEHMRESGKSELVVVFERLAAEERGHLASVEDWSAQIGVSVSATATHPDELFDDEGMNLTDPTLLSAYLAFSVAVRNEERAFLFWTYISAHAPNQEIAKAAERMAREELGHVSTLRRERRSAFHLQKKAHTRETVSISQLERKLEVHLQTLIKTHHPKSDQLATFAQQAWERIAMSRDQTLEIERSTNRLELSAAALAELLLDYHLDRAELSKDEQTRNLAQTCAGQLVATLAVLRRKPTA
ncbi:ferritin-like domain-containing protein [Rhizobium sp. LjRoot258]|uniref:ferritin-like domain-containing protein n=1 Tax=Rhizobium sp. LjRoot258 TaxID=3342299 RepID=UPI003ECCC065